MRDFRWQVSSDFAMAQACCGRWAARADGGQRVAVIEHDSAGPPRLWSFAQLQRAADALSKRLLTEGVQRGDRVAIVLPQRFACAVAYMAVLQMGAIAVPLSQLFGPEALEYRLNDSDAVLALADESTTDAVASVRARCERLRVVMALGAPNWDLEADLKGFRPLVTESIGPSAIKIECDDGAVLIYTSGTTGPPKGALIPHRALIGNLTGFVASQNWFGFDPARHDLAAQDSIGSQVFWSPADWAWTGGLMDALLPTLYFGRAIVAFNGRFTPEVAFEILRQHRVTHTFLFPTALKAMMKAVPKPRLTLNGQNLHLQAIMSAGEAVGDAVFAYCHTQLGVTVNEMFGQTEINYIVGNCARLYPAKPGSMGKGYPGHRVALIGDDGAEVAPGEVGEVAVHRLDLHGHEDPVFFLGYWKRADATRDKFTGDPQNSWCRTGDLAVADSEGYFWYAGRADDVFKSAGYRIGPSEVENCLVKHPAVANAAVVPKPDTERGAVVKAYVVLSPTWLAANGHSTTPDTVATNPIDSETKSIKSVKIDQKLLRLTPWQQDLVKALQTHVKKRLAPYEYPKEIEFVEALPMTTTGKVQRRVLRLQEEERAKSAAVVQP